MATTPNMNLALPTVSQTLGPEWATEINQAFDLVDTHDHAEGNGVPITPAGININADLELNDNGLLDGDYYQMINRNAADTTKLGSLQRIGSDFFYVNAAGIAVQITSGNSVVNPGSGVLSLTVVNSYPYSILSSDAQKVLIIDTSAARTLNLPSATNSIYVVIKDGVGSAQANKITVNPDGSDVVDGANSAYYIDANYASVGFISDGISKWYVI